MNTFFNSNQVVKQGEEGFVDISKAVKMSSGNIGNGCLTIIDTENSKRVKPSKAILEILGNPKYINAFFTEENMIICAADESGEFSVKKGGVIYSTVLANQIISMANDIDFKLNASTKCGSYHLQEISEGVNAVIISFK